MFKLIAKNGVGDWYTISTNDGVIVGDISAITLVRNRLEGILKKRVFVVPVQQIYVDGCRLIEGNGREIES